MHTHKLAGWIVMLALGGASAEAGASCYNLSCDHKDSGVQGCRDGQFNAVTATIKTSSGSVWGHVSLVYSPLCGAAWAYVSSAIGTVHNITAQVARQIGSGSIDSPYSECFDCTVKRSVMMGDVSVHSKAQATGRIEVHVDGFNLYIGNEATTPWF
jgi:hypothetical protein